MADRWWVNDDSDGDWNSANNWSATEGGAGGAGVPTASDDALFSDTSSGDDCTLSAAGTCSNLYTRSGNTGGTDNYTGTIDIDGYDLAVTGDIANAAGCTLADGGGTPAQITLDGDVTNNSGGITAKLLFDSGGIHYLAAGTYGDIELNSGNCFTQLSGDVTLDDLTIDCPAGDSGWRNAGDYDVTMVNLSMSTGGSGNVYYAPGDGYNLFSGNIFIGAGTGPGIGSLANGTMEFSGSGKTITIEEDTDLAPEAVFSGSYTLVGGYQARIGDAGSSGDLTVTGTLDIDGSDIVAEGDLSVSGTLSDTDGGGKVTVDGDVSSNTGTISAKIYFDVAADHDIAAGTYGDVELNGSNLFTDLQGAATFGDLTIHNTGASNMGFRNNGNYDVILADLTLTNDGSNNCYYAAGNGDTTISGNVSISTDANIGVGSSSNGTIELTGASKTFTIAEDTDFAPAVVVSGSYTMVGGYRARIGGTNSPGDLTVSGTLDIDGSHVVVENDLSVSGTLSDTAGTGKVTVDGDVTSNTGTITAKLYFDVEADHELAGGTYGDIDATGDGSALLRVIAQDDITMDTLAMVVTGGTKDVAFTMGITGPDVTVGDVSLTRTGGTGVSRIAPGDGELEVTGDLYTDAGGRINNGANSNGMVTLSGTSKTFTIGDDWDSSSSEGFPYLVVSGSVTISGGYEFTVGGTNSPGDLTVSGTLDNSNNSDIIVKGDIDFSGGTYTKGTGTLRLSGAGSGTQTIDTDGNAIENLVINDSGATKQLSAALTCDSLTVTAGEFDGLNSLTTVVGDLAVASGGVLDGNSTVYVGGSITDADGSLEVSGEIRMTGSGVKTIATGTYNCNLRLKPGTDSTTLTGRVEAGGITIASRALKLDPKGLATNTTAILDLATNSADLTIDSGEVQMNGIDATNYTKIDQGSATVTIDNGRLEATAADDWDGGTGLLSFTDAASEYAKWPGRTGASFHDVSIDAGAGTFDFSAGAAAALTIANDFTIAGGTVNNSVADLNLTVGGSIDFSGGAYTKGTGTFTLAGAGSGTQTIDIGGSAIEDLVVNDAGATKQLTADLVTDSLTVSAGTLAANNQSITTPGNIDFTGGTYTKGSGTFTLSGSSGTQTIDFDGNAVENLVVNASGATKDFSDDVSAVSIGFTAGRIDCNGNTFTTTGNFSVGQNALVDATGLAGATWTVGGNWSAAGAAVGSELDLKAASAWYLNVTGSPTAAYVDAQNSDASGGTKVVATDSIDSGGNLNWNFGGGTSPIGEVWTLLRRPMSQLRLVEDW